MSKRKSNCKCDYCGIDFYKRPAQIEKYSHYFCSRKCFGLFKTISKKCIGCENHFHPKRREQKFCSRACSDNNRETYNKTGRSVANTSGRLNVLRDEFDFKECMVDGCHYNKTYDIHRLIEGRNGGKYEIGNMFAICPNHHAELHRKLCTAYKKSDQEIVLVEKIVKS